MAMPGSSGRLSIGVKVVLTPILREGPEAGRTPDRRPRPYRLTTISAAAVDNLADRLESFGELSKVP
jgi:hypothetical protein